MKLSWSFLASSLYCTAAAVRPSVTPETARLIIAQRLGLAQFHSLDHADTEAIQHINTFGGTRQQLFTNHVKEWSGAHLLMWVEGVDEKEATVVVSDGSHHTKDFTISNPPASSENDRLLKDFISQAESLPREADRAGQTHGIKTFEQLREFGQAFAPEYSPEVHNGYLSVLQIKKHEKEAQDHLETMLKRVAKMDLPEGSSYTVVMLPTSSSHSKRTASPWGTYDVPLSNGARRQNPEAPLSAGPEPASSPAPPVSDLEDFPVIINQAKPKVPVRGILPSCFATLSSCQKTTNNCTGHGECKLLHKGRGSGKDQQTVDCYGCACSPTVQHVDEDKGMESKRKVTYWGGPACQKKDISVQFWLFVGTGVILAFLVASGIGMLYSMGGEELPSVIGAGVSGPVRK